MNTIAEKMIRFKNATFRYIFFRRARLETIHQGMGAGMKRMNEWKSLIYFQ